MYIYVYIVKESKIVLVRGLQEMQEGKKMLENEKYWNNRSIYEYNIKYYTVSSSVLGEHDDRDWESNGGC
jgi:hypothetical protein